MQENLTENVIMTIILYKGEECKVVGWGDGTRIQLERLFFLGVPDVWVQ